MTDPKEALIWRLLARAADAHHAYYTNLGENAALDIAAADALASLSASVGVRDDDALKAATDAVLRNAIGPNREYAERLARACVSAYLSALAAPSSGGEVVTVPREPTDAMLEAAYNAMFEDRYDGTQAPMIGAAYDALIAASPARATESGK